MRNHHHHEIWKRAQEVSSSGDDKPDLSDPVLQVIDRLLSEAVGYTIPGLSAETSLSERKCREVIRQIVDLGGEVEVRTCPETGDWLFRLHGYSVPIKPV